MVGFGYSPFNRTIVELKLGHCYLLAEQTRRDVGKVPSPHGQDDRTPSVITFNRTIVELKLLNTRHCSH